MGPEGSKGKGEMQLNYNLKNEKKKTKESEQIRLLVSVWRRNRGCVLWGTVLLRMLVDMVLRHPEVGVKNDRVIRFCFSGVYRL